MRRGPNFARVGASGSHGKKLLPDQILDIRWSFFCSYKETAYSNCTGIIHLIDMLPIGLLNNNHSGSYYFAEVVEQHSCPDFLFDILYLLCMKSRKTDCML